MRKLYFFLLLFLGAYGKLTAQQNTLKGTITDTLNKENLYRAVISLLRSKDSVLVRYTRSDTKGNFELKGLPSGDYLLMVTYPAYADYVEKVSLEPGEDKALGMLPLITKAKLLEEVIVRQRISAIRVKGDTTEYKADSFHVSPNADVQELLRKLPGIQVNSKGEITAQGEKVQKVLVDGEEFFSDDPAVVTKNLRADAVDKVQSYDRKSDQATFTGIDDGQKIKTLNIQLKEDKKKGFFGKIEAGTDFSQYRYGKALANAFKGKRKISGYLTTDNTKFESLNWDENRNYAGDANSNTTISDDGSIMIFSGGDDYSYGNGFPNSTTGGLHFSNKWNNDKHNSNNTYQFNQLNVTGISKNYTSYLLPGNRFNNFTTQENVSDRKRNKLTSIYEWQIDSSSSLKATLRAFASKANNRTNYLGQSISQDNNTLLNESNRLTTDADESKSLNGNLLYRKKFLKKGRSLSINSDLNFNDRNQNGFLLADNRFYDNTGALTRQDLIDQLKVNKQVTSAINTQATYTEPLWKNTFLVLNYRLNLGRNDAERNTFGKNGVGKYESRVDTLSNHYLFNTTENSGGLSFRYNVKKINFSAGTDWGSVTYRMKDVVKLTDRDASFNNFRPSVNFTFTPKQQRRVNISYNGSTRNPSLQQIQPIIDNTDPLNQTIGNPNLKQSFTHRFNFTASDYRVLKSRNMYININYSKTDNAITNASIVDNQGRRVNQAINVDGNYNLNSYLNYGFSPATSLNLGFRAGPGKSRNVNVINGIRNATETKTIELGFNTSYWGDKWINFYMGASANYNNSVSSIRPEIATDYWNYDSYGNLQLKFKKEKLYVDLNFNATIYQKTAAFANQQNYIVINPSIRKVISKNDNWEVVAKVNDLLNQNQRVSRNVNSNFISETTNQNIQRYFMFSLIYNFSKNGKPTNAGF